MQLNLMAIPTILGSLLLFWLGRFVGVRSLSRIGKLGAVLAGTALAIPGLLFVFYYLHIFDNAAWFYSFRALPYSEVSACGLGFIAGILHSWTQPQTLGERALCPVTLLFFMVIPFIKPVLSPIDVGQLQDRFEDGVVLQSTPSTCGPASAATILRNFGYPTSEKELAREAFTSRGGTENWYLARALRRRGLDVNFRIQSPDSASLPSPAIAGVILRGGVGHFIAILNDSAEEVTVADPLNGKHVINKSALKTYYHFTGFFLTVHPQPHQ
jgi:peptidase C39-like protein